MMKSIVFPPRPKTLDCYIECLTVETANALSPSSSLSRVHHDPRVLMYVDFEAKESREDNACSDNTDCETSPIFHT